MMNAIFLNNTSGTNKQFLIEIWIFIHNPTMRNIISGLNLHDKVHLQRALSKKSIFGNIMDLDYSSTIICVW